MAICSVGAENLRGTGSELQGETVQEILDRYFNERSYLKKGLISGVTVNPGRRCSKADEGCEKKDMVKAPSRGVTFTKSPIPEAKGGIPLESMKSSNVMAASGLDCHMAPSFDISNLIKTSLVSAAKATASMCG